MTPALRAAIEATTIARLDAARGFDAVVIGAGAAGGMAAMLLTQAGLRVLTLDAGWRTSFWRAPVGRTINGLVGTVADPRLQMVLPPRVLGIGRRALRLLGRVRQPVQCKCFAWEMATDAFVDDRESPYISEPDSRFLWFRSHQIGGRMIIPGHGRQYYRLSAADFAPNDELSPRWPLSPGELDRWYDQVEVQLRMSGGTDDCPWIPDGRMAQVIEPSASEAETADTIKRRWTGARQILGRSALPLASVDAAAATGRLSLRQGAVVSEVLVDPQGRASGARWYDRATRSLRTVRAPIVFLCASSLEDSYPPIVQVCGRLSGSGCPLGRARPLPDGSRDRLGRGHRWRIAQRAGPRRARPLRLPAPL